MERRQILRYLTALQLFLLGVFFLSRSVYGYSALEVYQARVYKNHGLMYFPRIRSESLYSVHHDEVWLELRFKGGKKIPLQHFFLSMNGLGGSCPLKTQLNPIPLSEWVKHSDNAWELRINLGNYYFGNKKSFLSQLKKIQRYNGYMNLQWRASYSVVWARLVFAEPVEMRKLPRVVFDEIEPSSRIVQQDHITFSFHSVSSRAAFECKLKGRDNSFVPCSSPLTLTGLKNRTYLFVVRALDGKGRPGPALDCEFRVYVPEPAVTVTRVVPAEEVTDQDSIEIYFKRNGPRSNLPYTYCRLDDGPFSYCTSPLKYARLTEGRHVVEIRETSWIYRYNWAGYLIRHVWFRWLWPVYTRPVHYSWMIAKQPPQVEWVETPMELSSSSDARFVFEATKPAQFRCTFDNEEAEICESPLELSGLSEGTHELKVVAFSGTLQSEPLSYIWKIDQTPPVIELLSVNPQQSPTRLNEMTLMFSVSEPSTILCELDGTVVQGCLSPLFLSDISDGSHSISVWVRDTAGNEAEPLQYSWEVDTLAPQVNILLLEPERLPSNQSRALFKIESNEQQTHQFCSLDGNAAWECTQTVELQDLEEGFHAFTVSSVDAAGNESSHSQFDWEVDLTLPLIRMTEVLPEETITPKRELEFHFEVSETSTVGCELDRGGMVPCNSPVLYNGLGEGPHELVLSAIDRAENVSEPLSYRWEIRSIVEVSIIRQSPLAEVTSSSTMQFEFVSSNGIGFVCALDDDTPKNCESPVSYSELQDGRHSFSISGLNLYGESGPVVRREWYVDRTSPQLSMVSIDPNQSPTEMTSMTVTFVANESADFYCMLDVSVETSCVSPWTESALSQGTHTISIVAVDGIGNRGQSAVYSWVIDELPPTVSITSVDPAGAETKMNSIQIAFSADKAVSYVCTFEGEGAQGCTSPWNVSALSDGIHTFEVSGVNSFGEIGQGAMHQWKVDTRAPVLTLNRVSPSNPVTNVNSLTMEFSADEEANFFCSLDSAIEHPCNSPWVVSSLSEASHSAGVVAVDRVGNRSSPVTHNWTIDATGPAVSITSVNPSASPTEQRTMTVWFSSPEAAVFYCSMDGVPEKSCVSPWTESALSQGAHTVSIVAVDGIGNRGVATTYSWVVDVPAPVVSINQVTPNQNPTNSTVIRFDFSAIGAASYLCRFDSGSFASCSSPANYSGLSHGAHRFEVMALNEFSEQGPSAVHQWTVDFLPPVVQITKVTPNWSPTAQTELSFEFVANESAVFFCSLDNGVEILCVSPRSLNGLSSATHTVKVYAVDSVGNRGGYASYTWVVDTTLLAITSEPYAVNVTSSSAVIDWVTNLPSSSMVYYGEGSTPSQWESKGTATLVNEHDIEITGLTPFKLYSVYVVSVDRDGREVQSSIFVFRTKR